MADPPLIEAVSAVRIGRVQSLLEAGADPDERGADGRTALIVAIPTGRAEPVTVLLDSGADPNIDDGGTTPLHLAAVWGFDEIVDLLLGAGADPTLVNAGGDTASDLARAQGHEDLADRLVAGP